MEDNQSTQEEEIGVLDSIYGDDIDFIEEKEGDNSLKRVEVKVAPNVMLQAYLPSRYPSHERPTFNIVSGGGPKFSHVSLKHQDKELIMKELESICSERCSEVVLFDCVEKCKEIVTEIFANRELGIMNESVAALETLDMHPPDQIDAVADNREMEVQSAYKIDSNKEIYHGEPVCDRKSVFQAHVCSVESKDEVRWVLQQLLMDKKIHRAHHPCMYAYRMRVQTNNERGGDNAAVVLADNDDDGEAGAGAKLANLLELLHVENVVVVVTRWYGGIQLGPDRFKHIANAARMALSEFGFLNDVSTNKESGKNGKKGKGNHRSKSKK